MQHVEQRVALGRRQDRGRLVENEDARVAVERLQNLDPLAHADRQIADTGVGVDRETVALRKLGDALARGPAVDEGSAPRLGAIDDIFPGRQRAEQLERLMHHAQARRHRVDRRTEANGRVAHANLARVRRLQAEQDAHQRRLARPVLAHHAVDLAAFGREIHAVIGDKAAVALDDADGFDLGHETRPGSAGYLALIGSAILIEPSTI